MADWPGIAEYSNRYTISTGDLGSAAGEANLFTGSTFSGATAWPAANRAIYCPVRVFSVCTVLKMGFEVTTQSGNYDIGIYDEQGNRLVSKGSTTVPVAGYAIVDITDTTLLPGLYFLALCIDNTTAAVAAATLLLAGVLQACGVQQQAVGAVTLPNPATFANPASAFCPALQAHLNVTV